MKSCPNCEGTSFTWGTSLVKNQNICNGLLRISDVSAVFYLGCDDCSETLQVVSPDLVAEELNKINYQP